MLDVQPPMLVSKMARFACPALPHGEIHIWQAWSNEHQSSIQDFRKIVSTDEIEKAQRFHFDKDKTRFIVERGLLRTLLSGYLDCSPTKIRFRFNAYGKPALQTEFSRDLTFNISHSNDLTVMAIARVTEIGIDVEQIRADVEFERIAEHFFSEREIETLRSLPPHQKAIAFYNCWTRKEAYLKALGGGLSIPLHLFDVSLAPGEPAQILACRGGLPDTHNWTLQALSLPTGYAGAVVATRESLVVKLLQWPKGNRV